MPPLTVMFKTVSSDCNLDCSYCYYRESLEGNRPQRRIDPAMLEKFIPQYMEYIDLTEVLNEAVAATSQLFREKAVAIARMIPTFPVRVFADRDRIIQVVINLLSNAAKFSPAEEGRVTVRLYFKEREIRVEVADNGPGIHPGEQQKIFEKFKQITDLRNGKPKGTGLGLAICRRIIEYHNGSIWVESTPGEGSKFIFSLPV